MREDVTTQVLKNNSKFLQLSFNDCVLFENILDLLLALWLLGGFLLFPVQEGIWCQFLCLLSSCFVNIFGYFNHVFTLNVPKVVVLNLFGHDFNFLHGNFIPLTVTWLCRLTTMSLVGFFFLAFQKLLQGLQNAGYCKTHILWLQFNRAWNNWNQKMETS